VTTPRVAGAPSIMCTSMSTGCCAAELLLTAADVSLAAAGLADWLSGRREGCRAKQLLQ
jgi:hypothetical protein